MASLNPALDDARSCPHCGSGAYHPWPELAFWSTTLALRDHLAR